MASVKIVIGILINLLAFSLTSTFVIENSNSDRTKENVLHKEFGVINEQSRFMST